jgi:hypothetical protein
MRRTLVTLAVVSLFAACGFPEVNYEKANGDDGGEDAKADGTTGADGASSGGDASEAGDATSSGDVEASTSGDAMGDSSTDGDAMGDAPGDSSAVDSSLDAIEEKPADSGTDAPADAPTDVHEAGDAAPLCDVDQDTYKAEGATCGGNDCCDTDNQAHPGQATFFTQADKCGSFDYNCNNQIDLEYPVNLKCGGTGITGCTGGSAFLGNPACGTSALYGTCVPNGALACQAGSEMTVMQGCN